MVVFNNNFVRSNYVILKLQLERNRSFRIYCLYTVNSLTDIIQRCHERHKEPLRQRKTVVAPALYKGFPYCFKVYCARGYSVMLDDLEQADISFMPIGRAPESDRGPKTFGGERFLKRQGAADWRPRRWHASWGIQVYTGVPSESDGGRWHDFDFKYEALCAAPDAVLACIEALVNAVSNPLLTMSKDGGLRFSCRVPDYLHPDTDEAQQYIYKHRPDLEDPDRRDVYLEIFGEKGYNCWDARYEILLGDLLDPPFIPESVLFAPIDVLRTALHEPVLLRENRLEPTSIAAPPVGSYNFAFAKEALMKRGFSYVRQENIVHHWIRQSSIAEEEEVLLWEDEETVWIRASTPNTELPTESTPITDVWDDTGMLPPVPPNGLPVSDEVLAIREGTLSPLAIKRPSTILHKPETSENIDDKTREQNAVQTQSIFDRDARILGLTTETGSAMDIQVESYLRDGGTICLNMPSTRLAEKAAEYFQARNVPSVAHWKHRMYRWDQVKDIPIDVRMENPFQHGNVCEDPERCSSLEEKGGNPHESICPQCPVYTQCQQRGYLSQFSAFHQAKAQIASTPRLFFDPRYTEMMDEILQRSSETERFCIIDTAKVHKFFPEYQLSKDILEAWVLNWQGSVLGHFAEFSLNAMEVKERPDSSAVKRIRAAVGAFASEEEALVRQMCQVNMRGRVIQREVIDRETGTELARFSIEFEGGISTCIPIDANAEDKLNAMGASYFPLRSFVPDEDIEIPMSMAEAIRFGILDTTTVENIQTFPTICRNPDWTAWHQLKYFFDYYTRDDDAPMQLHNNVLRFWTPPILHPNIKRLLLMSTNFEERHLRKVFPDNDIKVIRPEPAPWLSGNQVFQIRTGIYALETIVDYDNTWDVLSLSKTAQRFFLGIRAEIERDPNVKHAIITYRGINKHLEDIAKKENVCFVTVFNDTRRFESAFEEVQVLWIVGTPYWTQGVIWHRAQMLFGNDEKPLSYEKEKESDIYKDERVQSVYEQNVTNYLTEIIGRMGLDRWTNKKVVLMTSMPLSNITDRPEILLFDWEDFEIADGFDKLTEVIATREQFEAERESLTADSSREKVEHVLGCSSRQANRVLRRLRGGEKLRVPFREQILSLLSDGEKKTAELAAAIQGHPKAINNELTRLVEMGEIVKVQRGLYALPKAP